MPSRPTVREALDAYLLRWLDSESGWSPAWKDWAKHTMLGAGKALRPTLLFDFYRATSANRDERPSEGILRLGLAIELLHTFTLIHDDLPCMDDDDFRRGRPTLHRIAGESMAVLAGDAFHAASVELIASSSLPAAVKVEAVRNFSRRVGAVGLIEGQRLDILGASSTLNDLLHLHSLKTGELFSLSCELGTLAASGHSRVQDASKWGKEFGLLFQVLDDLLDRSATRQEMGKTPGKDARHGRKTILDFLKGEELKEFCVGRLAGLRKLSMAFAWSDPLETHLKQIENHLLKLL